MERVNFRLINDRVRQLAMQAVKAAPEGVFVEVRPATRSLSQNSLMWAMLADLAAQVNWHGQKLTADEWKVVLTASIKHQKVCPGIDGGFVALGQSTSKMTVREMNELVELIQAFGAQNDVRFSA